MVGVGWLISKANLIGLFGPFSGAKAVCWTAQCPKGWPTWDHSPFSRTTRLAFGSRNMHFSRVNAPSIGKANNYLILFYREFLIDYLD